MNEHAQKWVEALRSGEFQQGQDALRKGDRYCCLGVACELYRRETGNGKWLHRDYDGAVWFATDDDEGERASALPPSVQKWLGLWDSSGRYHEFISLAEKNDCGATFEEIATIIESEPDGLFQKERQDHDDA